jgi:hypothetical protein
MLVAVADADVLEENEQLGADVLHAILDWALLTT